MVDLRVTEFKREKAKISLTEKSGSGRHNEVEKQSIETSIAAETKYPVKKHVANINSVTLGTSNKGFIICRRGQKNFCS
jgi:hypothetical protein